VNACVAPRQYARGYAIDPQAQALINTASEQRNREFLHEKYATPRPDGAARERPVSAAPRHCLAKGIGRPRIACQPSNNPPATRERVTTRKKGAAASTPTLIAKNVVPQMTYTASKQAAISHASGLRELAFVHLPGSTDHP
jgi:hypothetical protein